MNRLAIIGALTVLCCTTLFYLQYFDSLPEPPKAESKFFLPELQRKLNDINEVVIQGSNGLVVEARLENNSWVARHLSDSGFFPLRSSVVAQFIRRLASAKIVAEKTGKPEYYPRLGVQGAKGEGEPSYEVTLLSDDSRWQVIIGIASATDNATYVRLPDRSTSMLVNQDFDLPANGNAWLMQPAMSIPQDTLQGIEMLNDEGDSIFKRAKDEFWIINTDFLALFDSLEFAEVVDRNSVLLNWFTHNPVRQVELTTETSTWRLSLYENAESEQVWMTATNSNNTWHEQWAFALNLEDADLIMSAPDALILNTEAPSPAQ